MKSVLDRAGLEPVDLPEPYGSLLAFLSDLHELAGEHPARDQASRAVVASLQRHIEMLAAAIRAGASKSDPA